MAYPNTITQAERYLVDESAYKKLFEAQSSIGSIIRPSEFVGAGTVKFQTLTWADTTTVSAFSKDTGYVKKGFTLGWKTVTLNIDLGNSLQIERTDNEAAMAGSIVRIHNRYIMDFMKPNFEKKVYAAILATTGIVKDATTALTKDNVLATIRKDVEALEEAGVDCSSLELRISPAVETLLWSFGLDKGQVVIGSTTFTMNNVTDVVGGKIIVVPASRLGCNYLLAPNEALNAVYYFQEATYFDKIPNFGSRMAQVDEGCQGAAYVTAGLESTVRCNTKALA